MEAPSAKASLAVFVRGTSSGSGDRHSMELIIAWAALPI